MTPRIVTFLSFVGVVLCLCAQSKTKVVVGKGRRQSPLVPKRGRGSGHTRRHRRNTEALIRVKSKEYTSVKKKSHFKVSTVVYVKHKEVPVGLHH